MSSSVKTANVREAENRLIRGKDDYIFDTVIIIITVVFVAAIALPLIYVLSSSLSDPDEVILGRVFFWPKGFTLDGYARIFDYKPIWIGYRNTALYTIVGTTVNLIVTLLCAYSLSRKELVGRKFFTIMFTFTMFFNGGLIPTYLLVHDLGLYNTFWAMILPSACSMYNVIIARTYFQTSIPEDLREAALIDGCTNLKLFMQIILPLAKPIIVVLALFYAVMHWNAFFNALLYLKDIDRMPLQMFLRNILLLDQFVDFAGLDAESAAHMTYLLRLKESMKFGIIVISTFPLLILCTVMQKFFVKGMMIGAVKG